VKIANCGERTRKWFILLSFKKSRKEYLEYL